MQKLIVAFFGLLFFVFALSAQTTHYVERFDNGVMTFDLNSTDVNSIGALGYNKFVINNSYVGGSGNTSCLGFPVSFNVPTTASQPAGITGSPNSNYLHTLSNIAESGLIYSCCFLAADGICSNGENYFSKMNIDINTTGYTGVSFNFWWLCAGGTNNYGEVYYSINSGINWNLLGSPVAQFKNQNNWTQTVITNTLFDNQNTLRFGFRFVNQTTLSAADPGFGIDDVTITGNPVVQPSLTTDAVTGNPFCPGENVTVDYTASGSFNFGNVFTAELSDALGNFSSPVTIGSVASTAPGTIGATIPVLTPLGTGYRIRVVSSSPAIVASDNGFDLTVASVPTVSLGTLADVCGKDAPFTMYGGSPTGGDYLGTGVSNNIFDPQTVGPGTYNILYAFTNLSGCSDSSTNKITVNPAPDASFSGLNSNYCNNHSPVNLVGSPSGGTFLGNGITGNVFTPSQAGVGSVEVKYVFINQQNCADTALQATTVDICDGIMENAINDLAVYFNSNGQYLVIEFSSAFRPKAEIQIWNMAGQMVFNQPNPLLPGVKQLHLKLDYRLNAGIYLVGFNTPHNKVTKKILLK